MKSITEKIGIGLCALGLIFAAWVIVVLMYAASQMTGQVSGIKSIAGKLAVLFCGGQ